MHQMNNGTNTFLFQCKKIYFCCCSLLVCERIFSFQCCLVHSVPKVCCSHWLHPMQPPQKAETKARNTVILEHVFHSSTITKTAKQTPLVVSQTGPGYFTFILKDGILRFLVLSFCPRPVLRLLSQLLLQSPHHCQDAESSPQSLETRNKIRFLEGMQWKKNHPQASFSLQ